MSAQRSLARPLSLLAALAALAAGPLVAEGTAAAAAPGPLTDAERQTLVEILERGQAETEALFIRAEGDAFTRKPAPERWSVGEVLEHIAATEELLLGMVETAVAAPPDPEAAALLQASPVSTLAERVRDRSQRAQAPEMLQPKGTQTREEGIARYRAARARTMDYVRTTQAAVGAHTAAFPGGKMTAHHLLTVIANHNLRHNQQIAEALEQVAAAAATAPAN
jgi:hypothetical protein